MDWKDGLTAAAIVGLGYWGLTKVVKGPIYHAESFSTPFGRIEGVEGLLLKYPMQFAVLMRGVPGNYSATCGACHGSLGEYEKLWFDDENRAAWCPHCMTVFATNFLIAGYEDEEVLERRLREKFPRLSKDAESFKGEEIPCEICGEGLFREHEDSMGDVCLSCYWDERDKQDEAGSDYEGWLLNFAESFSAENKTWEYREEIEELDGREHYYTFLKMARQAYTGMYIAAREAGATPNQAAAFCSSKWLRYMDDGDLIGNYMVKMWGKWFGLNDITDMVGEGYEISEIPRTELYENMEQIAKSGKEFNEKFYDAESFSADSKRPRDNFWWLYRLDSHADGVVFADDWSWYEKGDEQGWGNKNKAMAGLKRASKKYPQHYFLLDKITPHYIDDNKENAWEDYEGDQMKNLVAFAINGEVFTWDETHNRKRIGGKFGPIWNNKAKSFAADGYKGISAPKIEILESYVKKGGKAGDFHDLPTDVQIRLQAGNVHELLYQDVNRWLQDNGYNPHMETPDWLSAESHAYSYAYNEGHSDSRKREEYRPNLTTARQEGDFKKILKQKGD